jgi:hypothetical protein
MSTGTATAKVNVSIQPAGGSGPTELGMFNISVMPVAPTDQIINLQYIVSVEGQPAGDFVAFVFVGSLPKGAGLPSSIFYASCGAVTANRQGNALTVQVAGGINTAPNTFDVSQTFKKVLWPQGACA